MPTMSEVLTDDDHEYGSVWRINDPDSPSRHGAIVMKASTGGRYITVILEPAADGPRRGDSWGYCDIPVEPVTMEIEQRSGAEVTVRDSLRSLGLQPGDLFSGRRIWQIQR